MVPYWIPVELETDPWVSVWRHTLGPLDRIPIGTDPETPFGWSHYVTYVEANNYIARR